MALILNRIKKDIGRILISKFPNLKLILSKMNMYLFHFQGRMHIKHYGNEDADKVYYVIRPLSKEAGLMAIYMQVLADISYAINHDYIPVVDFNSNLCQYYTGNTINGSMNPWDWFFEQPSKIKIEDLKNKYNVIYSGWSFKGSVPPCIPTSKESLNNKFWKNFSSQYAPVNGFVNQRAEEIYTQLFKDEKTLGVLLRGTDYTSLKPSGHPVQPSVEQVCLKIDDFLSRYDISNIFLVTEDYDYYQKLKNIYGDKLFVSDDRFIKEYTGKGYLYEEAHSDAYNRAFSYLIRLMLLNKCQYLISGLTCGSIAASLINTNEYTDSYYFDLGYYE